MLRDILLDSRCCQEVAITLDEELDTEVLESVLDIMYRGEGQVPENAAEFQRVVNMLHLDSFVLRDDISEDQGYVVDSVIKHDVKMFEALPDEFSSLLLPCDAGEMEELVNTDFMESFEDDNFWVAVSEMNLFDYSDSVMNIDMEDEDTAMREGQIKESMSKGVKRTNEDEQEVSYDLNEASLTIESDDDIIEVSGIYESSNVSAEKVARSYPRRKEDKEDSELLLTRRREDKEDSELLLTRRKEDKEDSELLLASPGNEDRASSLLHCPFALCSYSHKSPSDFQTHIAARHYRCCQIT